jgi:hypothetical protein
MHLKCILSSEKGKYNSFIFKKSRVSSRQTSEYNIVCIIEIIASEVTLWFPVGISKDLFEDSNKGEGGVRYLPISLYHTHIIVIT